MNKKAEQILFLIKEDRKLFLRISFGVFLFVLFFQPFSLDHFDFNNRLLIVAGLAGIVFLIMVLVRAAFIWIIPYDDQRAQEPIVLSYLGGFLILALSSMAFAFYLRYVGSVEITLYTMFKIILICLFPPVSLALFDEIRELKQQNEVIKMEKEKIDKEIQKYEHDYLNKSVVFNSENSTENLTLLLSDVTLIKSADNYVEIVFVEDKLLKKKLIRNTLKNIEQQVKPYPNFIRCHRICIVNIHYIDQLNRKFNNYWLTIKGSNEEIPVSRQYLLKLKEVI
ncbi:MAG TPA: LytTR family DNA-binding domain-containing protein [Prolixibacteraceae bacterium]|nr:LytTR family DNA-binding domain-containing protein [Prolixibacteraceae bacterium]